MKNKLYFIISSIISMIACFYSIIFYKSIVNAEIEGLNQLNNIITINSFDNVINILTKYGSYLIIIPAIIIIFINAIVLLNAYNEKLVEKKGIFVALFVAIILLSPNSIINLIAIISLIVLAVSKNDTDKKIEKKDIPELEYKNSTNKEKIIGILLILFYFSQIIVGKFIPDNVIITWIAQISYDILLFIFVIYAFFDNLKNDLIIFKNNIKSYIPYLLSLYGIGLLLLIITNIIVLFITHQDTSVNQLALEKLPLIYIIPTAIIWAPIVEELIFRGVLRRFIPSSLIFIITSALVFGILHSIYEESLLNIIAIAIPYASLGGVLAYSYVKTNNLWSTIFIHMLHNTIAVILLILI